MARWEDDFSDVAEDRPASEPVIDPAPDAASVTEIPAPAEPETPAAEGTADDTQEGVEGVDPAAPVSQGRLNALLAERDKRQAAERERDELKAQMEAQRQTQQRQPVQTLPSEPPDPVLDPAGHTNWVNAQLYIQKAQMSRVVASGHYGQEAVDAAEAAFEAAVRADPSLMQKARVHHHPYGFAVEWHKQQQIQQQFQGVTDMDAFIAAEAEKRGFIRAGTGAPVIAATKVVTSPTIQPPRSLASAPAMTSSVRPAPSDPEADAMDRKLFGSK